MNSRYPRENEPEAGRKAARRIACCAKKALLYEVSVTPKPGLVDRADSGCHRDMDYHTFLDSIASLPPYFEICAAEGAAVGAAGFPQAEKRRTAAQDAAAKHVNCLFMMNTSPDSIAQIGEDAP